MHSNIHYLIGLVGLPLLGFGQTTPASSRFYVGVGANLLTDVPFNSAGTPTLLGPSLTAGVQLTPRLALQLSPAYYWRSDSYTSSSYYYGTGGSTIGGNTTTNQYKYLSVPVLLRYTVTEPAARFHVDGLAGLTVLYGHFSYTTTPYSSYYYPNDYASSSTKANATLGPAIRYALSSSVELTANGLVSAVIGDTYTHFGDRLFFNALLGAQYTFGQL